MEMSEIKKPQNQFQRAMNIILSPMSVIEDIKLKPNFLLPLGLILLVGIISTLLTKDLAAQLIEMSYANANLTPDQIAAAKEINSGFMTAMMYIGIVMLPLIPLIKGCVSHLLSILFGGEGTFAETTSLMVNAYLIQMLGTVIALPIMLMTSNGAFGFSPALLLPMTKFGTPIYSTLTALNLFAIWYLIVSIMGVKKIHNVATWKAALIVLLPFILVTGFAWIGVLMGAPSGL
jgi:hypothetical protein